MYVCISGEQAKQLAVTDAKMVFCISDDIETIRNACDINKSKLPIVAFNVNEQGSLSDGVIDLNQIMEPTGKYCLYIFLYINITLNQP